jgi:hypothetical protein
MWWWILAGSEAAACSWDPEIERLSKPSEGAGIWFWARARPFDVTLDVDGVAVPTTILEYPDVSHELNGSYGLLLPDVPLVEGQSWELAVDNWSGIEVTSGTVDPAASPDLPLLEAVSVGPYDGGGACISTGDYRFIDLSFGEGLGLVLLDDAGVRVKAAFVTAEATEVSYLRDGGTDEALCLDPIAVGADGVEVVGEPVCSAGWGPDPAGCATVRWSGGSGLVLLVLAGLRRRR